MNQDNGGIIGKINTPTTSLASGVWSLDSQFDSQSSSIWPLAFPNTTIANSCRFNGASSEDLERTPSSSGNNNKNTLSVWLKRSKVDEEDFIIYGFGGSANRCKITFKADNKLQINTIVSSSNNLVYETNRLFRDTSAWYHFVIAFDSTLSTAGDRCRLYVNGVEETSFATETDMGQNTSNFLSTSGTPVYIGSQESGNYFDGYMTEFVFVDGQQLEPTAFGAFNPVTNIWEPIGYGGTYGTNGFRLDFADSSALGNDVSGNDNDFTVQNLTSVDQSTDTCSNNFATLNPLVIGNSPTLSEGNLKFLSSDANWRASASTIGVTQGKWYTEFKLDSANDYVNTGIATMSHFQQTTNVKIGYTSTSYGYDANNGNYYVGDSATSYGASLSSGDILGVALDLDNNKLYFSKNGTFQNSGVPTSGSTGTGAISITSGLEYFMATSAYGSSKGASANFGSPSFSISSGNADANGHGNFEYAPPSGYFALCTKNLAEFGG